MKYALIFALVVVASAVAVLVIRHARSTREIKPYGDIRRDLMRDTAAPLANQPPPRPPHLDTRLPAAKAAELRAACSGPKESFAAATQIHSQIVESIRAELAAIDPDVEWVQLLSPARRAVLLVEALEIEINNGGFDQYYLNSSGDGAPFAPAALRLLGHEAAATLVERGNAQFASGPPTDRSARLRMMDDLGEQPKLIWDSLDKQFYKLELPKGGLSIGLSLPYILAHESDFFRPM